MESTESMPEPIQEYTKYGQPDEDLVSWFYERLELEKERKQYQHTIKGGGKLPNSLQKKLNTSAARKGELLNDIIFPSLANLIYFFEGLTFSPNLTKVFEKDLVDLLDPRSSKKSADDRIKGLGMNTTYVFHKNNLARLIAAIVQVDSLMIQGKEKPPKDFRYALMYQIMSIIHDKMQHFFTDEYGWVNQITISAHNDLGAVLGWMALVASVSNDKSEQKQDRGIGFLPITLSRNNELRKMKWQ